MAEFKPITQAEFERKRRVPAGPVAVGALFDARRRRIVISLDSGIEFSFEAAKAHGLESADDSALRQIRIEGAGETLRFPSLDVDFSIPRLLEGFLGPLAWTRRLARAEASRRNGALGGRPRKAAA
jgi:hypothetical protein